MKKAEVVSFLYSSSIGCFQLYFFIRWLQIFWVCQKASKRHRKSSTLFRMCTSQQQKIRLRSMTKNTYSERFFSFLSLSLALALYFLSCSISSLFYLTLSFSSVLIFSLFSLNTRSPPSPFVFSLRWQYIDFFSLFFFSNRYHITFEFSAQHFHISKHACFVFIFDIFMQKYLPSDFGFEIEVCIWLLIHVISSQFFSKY